MARYTVTHSPCETDETPFSYEEDAFIGWVDEVFCEGYKRADADTDGRPQTAKEAIDILESYGYDVEVEVEADSHSLCVHDHGDGWLKRELSHMRDHWFSCLLGCIIVHLAMDGAEALWSFLRS